MKDFSLFDEKCGTCLTIGYLASAAVAAILAGLVGGSFLTQVVIFVVAAAVLGYAANRYCMGRMAAEIAEEESPSIVKRAASDAKAKAENAVEAGPSAVAKAAEKVEEGAAEVKEAVTRAARPEAADPGDDASAPARDPAAPDDRQAALDAARTAAEEQAKTRAAMQKAVDALNARKSE